MTHKLIILSIFFLAFWACQPAKKEIVVPTFTSKPLPDGQVATKWADLTLQILWQHPNNSPVYASRALGLLGIAMYESVVYAAPTQRSLAGQLNQLNAMPLPVRGSTINWNLSLNASQAYLLKELYYTMNPERIWRIDSLYNAIINTERPNLTELEIAQSLEYGKKIAEAVYNWSKTDGGHLMLSKNFDPNYKYPTGKGKWQPPLMGQVVSSFPLQPHWGNNRPMVPANAQIKVPDLIPYSEMPNSDYYKYNKEVYDKNITLTTNEKEIAAWWADDPSETFSPPGHSYSIASIVVKKQKVNLVKAAETYARVGMAVADAFINCWKAKYTYHCERPSKFVRAVINPGWVQFWPEPPFPSFYSGHSVQGSAAATVLTSLYGANYEFSDETHSARHKDFIRIIDFKTRHYTSFEAMAEESAYSRFLGGIHTKLDNNVGLAEGKKVGNNINALQWSK
jgi:hypothetical protein